MCSCVRDACRRARLITAAHTCKLVWHVSNRMQFAATRRGVCCDNSRCAALLTEHKVACRRCWRSASYGGMGRIMLRAAGSRQPSAYGLALEVILRGCKLVWRRSNLALQAPHSLRPGAYCAWRCSLPAWQRIRGSVRVLVALQQCLEPV
jgi:hypothetical protein